MSENIHSQLSGSLWDQFQQESRSRKTNLPSRFTFDNEHEISAISSKYSHFKFGFFYNSNKMNNKLG